MFNPLDYPIALGHPGHFLHSAWLEHVPFAMTVVEMTRPGLLVELGVHRGVSYCGFCQAIDHLDLDTRAYGIDTWEGDPHGGFTDVSILDELKLYHDPRYGRFSNLVRSKFTEAADRFADCSIDLLHIDGYHTYDAVKEDFDTWRPKMSARGVILFHDIRARLPGFGVWKLWNEVEAVYPSFAFDHQYGLGVAAVGGEIPEGLRPLIDGSPVERGRIRRYFSQLGERLSCRLENRTLEQRIAELEAREIPVQIVAATQAA